MHFPFEFVSLFPLAFPYPSVVIQYSGVERPVVVVDGTFLVFSEYFKVILKSPRPESNSNSTINIEFVFPPYLYRNWWCRKEQTIAALCYTIYVAGWQRWRTNQLITQPDTVTWNKEVPISTSKWMEFIFKNTVGEGSRQTSWLLTGSEKQMWLESILLDRRLSSKAAAQMRPHHSKRALCIIVALYGHPLRVQNCLHAYIYT